MNSRERVMAAIAGDDVDRPPYSLWRHFPDVDTDPERLAAATVDFARRWRIDLVKHTPHGYYAVEDWGGTIRANPAAPDGVEVIVPDSLATPAGWRSLRALKPGAGALGRELEALRLVRDRLDPTVPLVMTIYSPLTLAWKLVGPRLFDDIRESEEELLAGLRVIAQTVADFARAALESGADGLFFATQLATRRYLTPSEYAAVGERFDEIVLNDVRLRTNLLILHLHGTDTFFNLANRYPVDAVHWHDRETEPGLAEAMGLTTRGLVAGLDRQVFVQGPEAVRRQTQAALDVTDGRRLILAPSCVIPVEALDEALQAVGDEVERWATTL